MSRSSEYLVSLRKIASSQAISKVSPLFNPKSSLYMLLALCAAELLLGAGPASTVGDQKYPSPVDHPINF
jgi:hypothetical protein